MASNDQLDEPFAMAHYLARHGGAWPVCSPSTEERDSLKSPLMFLPASHTGQNGRSPIGQFKVKAAKSYSGARSPRSQENEGKPANDTLFPSVKRPGELAPRRDAAKRFGRKGALSLAFEGERAKLVKARGQPDVPQSQNALTIDSSHPMANATSTNKDIQIEDEHCDSGASLLEEQPQPSMSSNWVEYDFNRRQFKQERLQGLGSGCRPIENVDRTGGSPHLEAEASCDELLGAFVGGLRTVQSVHNETKGEVISGIVPAALAAGPSNQASPTNRDSSSSTLVVKFRRDEIPAPGWESIFRRVEVDSTGRKQVSSRRIQSGLSLLLKPTAGSCQQIRTASADVDASSLCHVATPTSAGSSAVEVN